MGGDKDMNFMNSESKGLKGIWAWEESYSWGGNVLSICLKTNTKIFPKIAILRDNLIETNNRQFLNCVIFYS